VAVAGSAIRPAAAGLAMVITLGIAPGASAAVHTPAAAPTARRLPVAYDCRGWREGRVKTDVIALSCFGSVVVTATGWKYWTGVSARASGARLLVDSCKPTCATGKFRKYHAIVVLYRVRSHRGTRYYSRLKLRYRHRRPRTYIYRWAKYPGATIPVWIGGPSGHS
jgi:hypothetical protein